MISNEITDQELEMFAAEPENNLAFVPNHAMAQKMARELLALRKASQWIRCDERMPEEDTLCLAIDEEGVFWTAHYDCGELRSDIGGVGDVPFTHWQRLPSPPIDKA